MAHERIITSPTIAGGEPVIRNTNIPVHRVLAYLAKNLDPSEVARAFPDLELTDVEAVLAYAATVTRVGMGRRLVQCGSRN